MFRTSFARVTVYATQDIRRAKGGNTYPIKICVCYNRKQKYYPTGQNLTTEEWATLGESRITAKLKDTRKVIENCFDLIKGYVKDLTSTGDFSFAALNLRLRGAATSTVNVAMRARIEQMRKEERYGNMQVIQCALNAFERFVSANSKESKTASKGNTILFETVTAEWLRKYEQYELNRGIRHTTIAINLRQLRAVFNEAKRMGIIKHSADPFADGRFAIRSGEGRKLALSLRQIKLLATYSGNATMEKYRDIWMFIYLCNGINIADLMRLKYCNIHNGEICYVRRKTRHTTKTVKEIRAIITPLMQDIINKWGNKYAPNAYIFPILKGGETEAEIDHRCTTYTTLINTYTKKLGRLLGIGDVTTYTARHSFATVLKRSGANIAYISESLGHSNLKITENYLASFEREERERNAALLTNFD